MANNTLQSKTFIQFSVAYKVKLIKIQVCICQNLYITKKHNNSWISVNNVFKTVFD